MDSPRDESTTEENLVMVLMNSIVIYFVYIWDENLIEISVPNLYKVNQCHKMGEKSVYTKISPKMGDGMG